MAFEYPLWNRTARFRRNREMLSLEGEWQNVSFALTGGDYFRMVLEGCQNAKTTIRLETYIFEIDAQGEQVLQSLRAAADRGVKVRLLVDAIGSPEFSSAVVDELNQVGVRTRVFGRPRNVLRLAMSQIFSGHPLQGMQTLRKFQLRNHRKLALFDDEVAYVGSANIGGRFSEWRETTVALRGKGVVGLRQSFVRSWNLAARKRFYDEFQWRSPAIRTNFTTFERRATLQYLLDKIRKENKRIYFTTAYFHPRPRLLLSILSALKRGVDVRILSPKHSDITWFPWISRAIYTGLLENGAQIYEYDGPMNHAKTTLFSDSVLLGSTNMNYRSFMHDLELDVVLVDLESIHSAEEIFGQDVMRSVRITREANRHYALVANIISFLLWPIKRWL